MVRADYHKAERLSRQLMAYGERIDSDRCRSFANAYMGSFYVARGRLEEGLRMLDKARVWAEEEHNDTVQAISLNGLGIYCVMAENNLVIALKYFNEAKTYAVKASLPPLRFRIESNVVQTAIIRNDTTMLDYAIGCFEEAGKLQVRPAMPIMARHIARLLILKRRFADALSWLDKADAMGFCDDDDRIVGEMLRGEVYLRQRDHGKAYGSYRKALGLVGSATQEMEAYIGLARAKLVGEDYAACKAYAAKVRSLADKTGIIAYDADYYSIMKDACAALGQWREAYGYSDKLNKCIEEQADTGKEYVQKQITTAMQVERKEQEAEMRRLELQSERRRNIILGAVLALVLLLSAVLAIEIREKTGLYRTIVRQFREAITERDDLRRQLRQQEADAADDGKEKHSSPDARMAEGLWRALMKEMEENEVYLEPGMSREALAKLLGTNRTYLSKIIYANTGLGYTQFINSWRIEAAVRILSDTSRADYPLKAICRDIGFSSMTTFYKLFKARTGMTPSVFRKNA